MAHHGVNQGIDGFDETAQVKAMRCETCEQRRRFSFLLNHGLSPPGAQATSVGRAQAERRREEVGNETDEGQEGRQYKAAANNGEVLRAAQGEEQECVKQATE